MLEEDRESRQVLADLSELVGALAQEIKVGLDLTAQLDFIMARARYCARFKGVAAIVSDTGGFAGISLVNARHPLLGDAAVPITLRIDPETAVLVVTGPNTGGKTVSMKTVGLLALMHHSGLYIPAGDGSSLPVFDGIYADIGDQQSVMGSVSTFSSHMLNVMGILERATRNSLVLLDELGTSTDPEEGSALAKAILGHLASKGVTTIATTHHRNVAAFADATPGMLNASVDLDPDTLRPTYTLTIGVPGRSYAMSIATQLGLQEKIIARARSLMDPGLVQYESWLDELQKQRTQLRVLLEEAEQGRADAEITKRDAESELADIQDRRDEILQTMRRELSAQFDDIRKQLRRAEATASWESPRGEPVDYKRATKDLEKVRSKIETFAQQTQQPAIVRQRPLRVGDAVAVMGLNLEGLIVTIDPETQEAEVAVGDVRFNLDLARLQLVETPQEKRPPEKRVDVSYSLGPLLTSNELHIRGMRAEDAMMEVEEFLDKALRDGASSVRIVHGKGTGVLRNGVRELLDHNALVKSYDFAEREHGGTGVTVVELA